MLSLASTTSEREKKKAQISAHTSTQTPKHKYWIRIIAWETKRIVIIRLRIDINHLSDSSDCNLSQQIKYLDTSYKCARRTYTEACTDGR